MQDQKTTMYEVSELLEIKKAELSVYSPYSFLRFVDPEILSDETFIKPLKNDILAGSNLIKKIKVESLIHYFIFRNLHWDTHYFKRRICKIELILFDHSRPEVISKAVNRFIEDNIVKEEYYFINIPCEDLLLIQGLSSTGFRLVETRLNYYFPNVKLAQLPQNPVRRAEEKDITTLRDIAMRMRNRYDRIHADPAFSEEMADKYLGTFIEEAVKGFADMVIVPDVPGTEPFGFLAANNPKRFFNLNISKLVLAAVDGGDRKGWLYHLLIGVIYELRKQDTDILTTITQASNRPAIRTWEKAGFKLGYVTHVFSVSK